MKRDSIVMFRSQIEAIMMLTSIKDVRAVLALIVEYGMNGKYDVDVPEHLQFGWTLIKNQIDLLNANYEEKSVKCREAANKRWMRTDANGCERMQTDADGCNNDNDNDLKENIYNTTHTHEEKGENPGYPKSVDDIISLASRHGIKILASDAQNYLDDRMRKDWTPTGSYKKIPLYGIPGDIRIWTNTADNKHREQQRNKQNDSNSIGGRPRQKLGF